MDTRICSKPFCVDLLLCRCVTAQIRGCADLRHGQIRQVIRRLSLHITSGLQNFTDTRRAISCVSAIPVQDMQVCKAMEVGSSRLSELQGRVCGASLSGFVSNLSCVNHFTREVFVRVFLLRMCTWLHCALSNTCSRLVPEQACYTLVPSHSFTANGPALLKVSIQANAAQRLKGP